MKKMINFDVAEQFLNALSPEGMFTFQTFDDRKVKNGDEKLEKRRFLTKVLHGKFKDNYHELVRLNRLGAGIYVTISQTDLRGRSAQNIVTPRAAYVEFDGTDIPHDLKLKPSMIIDSKHGPQVYFLLEKNEPLQMLKPTLASLVSSLKSDPACKDICRVLRIPGFYHLKDPDYPFLVKIRFIDSDLRYRFSDIHSVYPIQKENDIKVHNQKKIYSAPQSKKNQKFDKMNGDFNLIVRSCPAIARVWNDANPNHISRLAVLFLAIHCRNGIELLQQHWPSEKTYEAIRYACQKGYAPMTCLRLQQDQICRLGIDPIIFDKCFSPRFDQAGHTIQPSPIRLSFGARRAHYCLRQSSSILKRVRNFRRNNEK